MEWTLGVLLSAGHDPDHLLDSYSFEQLALYARCTLGHHVKMLNMLLSPVLGSTGTDWKDASVPRPKTAPTPRTDAEEEAREERLMKALAFSPFGVRTVQTSAGAEGGPEGGG